MCKQKPVCANLSIINSYDDDESSQSPGDGLCLAPREAVAGPRCNCGPRLPIADAIIYCIIQTINTMI